MSNEYSIVELSQYLPTVFDIPSVRADSIARELAEAWNAGDFTYRTTKDIIDDHWTDDDSRGPA